ncbi:UNVERIFIED_CONTAM: hypothetical protein Sradi_3313400 [Sesamum radiatum]|uniref:DUF4218 domain-containing protein n=1 Tax=Sesamum radiatum TaxID=300843 RepID=A0AAW2R165_SESRA
MCMNSEYMFLTTVIPGPSNLKHLIDVYLEPLIDELLQLWHVGVRMHDHTTNQAFMMRAALMWTMNDLSAYGMASGWSTTGIMGCPICMDDTRAFHLQHGRKACYFDCHRWFLPQDHPYRRNKKSFTKNHQERNIARPRLTEEEIRVRVEEYSSTIKQPLIHPPGYGTYHKWTKKSIFWDLPYWTTHLIRHNLDVMHVEKNVFDNIFNTVMDIKGKSKDNLNARNDLTIICNRPELQIDERRPNVMPKAVYTLTKDQKRKVCEWVKCLRFPDGYASNLSRCVDMTELRLHGMKSHDCHIFMQKLIPVAFREMVPAHVWSALTEVSLMFQVLCSTTLDIRKVQELEDSVAVIMCNLEKVFPPAFFDSMEHLILHLPYEARMGGPVQYMWMYLFERWVDPTRGMKVHPRYHLVDVNFKWVYQKDEPFILAQQAVQVYYTEYPSMRRDKVDWMAVCKTKARRLVDESHWTNVAYQEEQELPVTEVNTNHQTYDLHDPDGLQLFVDLLSTMQHGAGTSRTDEDDEYEDDEDSFDDYETDEESEERDNNSD